MKGKKIKVFVNVVNKHRKKYFIPSGYIYADGSMRRWYEVSGQRFGVKIPTYISMYGKPENDCEIQSLICLNSKMQTRLPLVK